MEMNILENGQIMKKMDLGNVYFLIKTVMKDIGLKAKDMDKEFINGLKEILIMDSGLMIR